MSSLHRRFTAVLLPLAAAIALAAFVLPLRAAAPLVIAVPDVGFSDSSGEVRDQSPEHAARLRSLTESLRADLGKDGRLESLAVSCEGGACALDEAGIAKLRQRAQQAGASLVLVCDVHKMSTLVLAMKVGVLEVATGRVVMERLLSFRGDNDEGWRRAGAFVARDVADNLAAAPK